MYKLVCPLFPWDQFPRFSHCTTWSVGFPFPIYLCVMSPSLVLNIFWISLLHCFQYSIVPLCVTHYLIGMAFNTKSSVRSLCYSGTCASDFCMNVGLSFNPSYLGKLHNSIPIHHNELVILADHCVETSCILCCPFSRIYSKSNVHELMLLQINVSPVVGLT